MSKTTIAVIVENGEVKYQIEKGAMNGSRPDQKIATQLITLAQKMNDPNMRNQANAMMGNPMIKQMFQNMGLNF